MGLHPVATHVLELRAKHLTAEGTLLEFPGRRRIICGAETRPRRLHHRPVKPDDLVGDVPAGLTGGEGIVDLGEVAGDLQHAEVVGDVGDLPADLSGDGGAGG